MSPNNNKTLLKKRNGKLVPVSAWAVSYKMNKDTDFTVEDDSETKQAIDQAAGSEFKRLIERLKEEEKKAKDADLKEPS